MSREDVTAVLIQRGEQILAERSPKLGNYAAKKLRKRNVDVRCGRSATHATATSVYLNDGSRIGTRTLVTTVGNGRRSFTKALGFDLERGKIPVDRYLRAKGSAHIWALGDAALVPLSNDSDAAFAPPTAQYAVGRHAA